MATEGTKAALLYADVFPRPCATERSRPETLVFHHSAKKYTASSTTLFCPRGRHTGLPPFSPFRASHVETYVLLMKLTGVSQSSDRTRARRPSHLGHNVAK